MILYATLLELYISHISVYITPYPLSNLNSHHSHHFHSSCQLSTQTLTHSAKIQQVNNPCFLPNLCHSVSSYLLICHKLHPFFTHTHNNTLHCTLLHYTYTTLVNDTLVPPQGYGPRRPTRALFISPVS